MLPLLCHLYEVLVVTALRSYSCLLLGRISIVDKSAKCLPTSSATPEKSSKWGLLEAFPWDPNPQDPRQGQQPPHGMKALGDASGSEPELERPVNIKQDRTSAGQDQSFKKENKEVAWAELMNTMKRKHVPHGTHSPSPSLPATRLFKLASDG